MGGQPEKRGTMAAKSVLPKSESTTPGLDVSLSTTVLWVAGGLGIIATVIAAVLPVLVGIWQARLGFRADQAGFVAAAELFAQVVGTGVFIWAARAWSWRVCAAVGLVIMIIGNLASAASVDLGSLIATRTIAGIGGGGLRALCMTCLARAASPGLAFAVYAAAQVALAASMTALLPAFVGAVGPHGPFVLISAVAACGFLLMPMLPPYTVIGANSHRRKTLSIPPSGFWAIAALFIYFAGQGAIWTYIELIGRSHSIPEPDIVRALTLLNIAGLIGALGVGALAHRANPMTALVVLLGAGIVSIAALFNTHAPMIFVASACGFYFAWCASFPFQFTIISRTDRTGTASAAVPAVDGLGLASGAALAGVCIRGFGVVSTGWMGILGSVLGVACYAAATVSAQKRIEPAQPPPYTSNAAV